MAGSVLGAALQLQQAALWPWLVYACLLAAACGAWLCLRARWAPPALWLHLTLALCVGAMAGSGLAGWRATAYAANALSPALEGRDLLLVGRVASMPQHGAGGSRFAFEVESAHWADAGAADPDPPRVPSRVSLAWYAQGGGLWARAAAEAPPSAAGRTAPVHAGERWRMVVRLRAPHGSLNPHGFDHELRMWEQGEHASGQVRNGARDPPPERLGSGWRHPVERLRETVRDAVFEQIEEPRRAGVIAALVTGDQRAIERSDWDIFRATGVAHLMSISGLHITMFAWLAALAVGALWRCSARLMLRWPAQHAAIVGGLLLATLYALFSGWGLPSQRTVLMLGAIGLLRLTGRRWPWPFVWLSACAVVVAVDPWALMQAGFWLSFVAVGVLFAAEGAAPAGAPTGIGARLLRLLREQWIVTLALTPLTLLLFQQVSAVGLLANAIAIPWVTLVVTPLAMLGVVVPSLWHLAAGSVQALLAVLEWLAGLPFATLSMPAPPLWMAAAGVAGGVLLAMRLPWTLRALGLPLLLPALLWQAPRPAAGEFDLLAADIGQGSALLVRTATHSLLYDAGPRYSLESDAGQRVLVPLLRALGERLDTVLLSHRDSDHTGGAAAVLAAQPQATLLSSIEDGHPLKSGRAARRCEAGQRWTWDGVDFEVLHPQAGDYTAFVPPKPNSISCVLRIGNGRTAALLAGDIERLQEMALVARRSELRADVLLVPHHGSRTSSSALLLDAVRPRIALVQAGWRNRFGHPAEEVVGRYRERGIALVESSRCGAATWSSSDPGSVKCQRHEGRRYWNHVPP
ncbi:DNA internalization-related competence protein ComEC/Rec2 [Variovorax saccharolyticus]|uniref:DNA internalization-related competence protein ComEC/Rec2 n=1 Tax=Variovorax saccharolyticus TaxID=3053516 RepID=UPI002574F527|nr:DNA internalization-related competence protein ComEC/Rec2 [Variovorax sp. J22R187]MDM0016427.1 DNA internalization-related competence protein ComEC/Rec2 [Variovorax sp. J22R187]